MFFCSNRLFNLPEETQHSITVFFYGLTEVRSKKVASGAMYYSICFTQSETKSKKGKRNIFNALI